MVTASGLVGGTRGGVFFLKVFFEDETNLSSSRGYSLVVFEVFATVWLKQKPLYFHCLD